MLSNVPLVSVGIVDRIPGVRDAVPGLIEVRIAAREIGMVRVLETGADGAEHVVPRGEGIVVGRVIRDQVRAMQRGDGHENAAAAVGHGPCHERILVVGGRVVGVDAARNDPVRAVPVRRRHVRQICQGILLLLILLVLEHFIEGAVRRAVTKPHARIGKAVDDVMRGGSIRGHRLHTALEGHDLHVVRMGLRIQLRINAHDPRAQTGGRAVQHRQHAAYAMERIDRRAGRVDVRSGICQRQREIDQLSNCAA